VRLLCTIGARGGSKGVPNKNLRTMAGLPLLAHTIRQAKESGLFDAIAFSSDSHEILRIAAEHGADILIDRPPEMASDLAAKPPAIRHCLLEAEKRLGHSYGAFVDLDVTSPLRLPSDIQGAVRLFEESGVSNVITGCPARHSPYFTLVETDGQGHVQLSKTLAAKVVRRQDSPPCWDMNGSIYVWRREPFLSDPRVLYPDTKLYEMPAERSVDIDSELDWRFVEFLLTARRQPGAPSQPHNP
jgi:N-acylneuraminate cytidylyltransferase/CMP-N,N'-diacetyllegionaminic acid synthase